MACQPSITVAPAYLSQNPQFQAMHMNQLKQSYIGTPIQTPKADMSNWDLDYSEKCQTKKQIKFLKMKNLHSNINSDKVINTTKTVNKNQIQDLQENAQTLKEKRLSLKRKVTRHNKMSRLKDKKIHVKNQHVKI